MRVLTRPKQRTKKQDMTIPEKIQVLGACLWKIATLWWPLTTFVVGGLIAGVISERKNP